MCRVDEAGRGCAVASHMALGGQVGVTGTPALLLADGRLIPGYLPVDKLLQTLGLEPI